MEATTVCAHCGVASEGRPLACPSCDEDPRVQGRYRLEEAIGRGGSAITWRARREPGGDPICLKELRWASMGGLDDERRFTREGELLAALDHPSIPRHHGAFAWGEGRAHALFIAQDLVVGDNLERERAHRGYTTDEVLAMGAELADVLVYLHERHPPVVHRDLKPSNIMRRVDGRLMLVDFGAARLAGLGPSDVSVAGTFGFMAPEQIRGEAGPAADVYGLGMTLAVLASGGPPEELLDASNTPDLDRLARHGAALPPAVKGLVAAMLARDPAERPSAREVARRCRAIRRGDDAPRPTPGPQERPAIRPEVHALADAVGRRVRRAVIGSGVVAVAGSVFMVLAQAPEEEKSVAVTTWSSSVSVTTDQQSSVHIELTPTTAPVVEPPAPPPEPTLVELGARCRGAEAPASVTRVAACDALFMAAQRRSDELGKLGDWPAPLDAACAAGLGEVCQQLAFVWSQGLGVEGSRTRTYQAFTRGCEAGHVESCASQGRMALKGDGTPIDWAVAMPPLDKACTAGDLGACVNRGKILADGGHGVRADRAAALGLFDDVCQRGERVACDNVDAMIGNGWGLPTAASERAVLLTRLCEHRAKTACMRLGDLLARGGSGVKKDLAAARERYARACDLGLPEACNKLR